MTAARPRFRSAAEQVRHNAYDAVADRVLALLERGTVPWRRTWSTAVDAPRNMQGRPYRGINTWLLGGQGYGSPHWLTWKQIHEHGGRVLKGERSTPVVFWKQIEVDEDGETRRVPIARLYNVWNLEQCQGIEPPDDAEAQHRTPVEPLVAAERIVDGMPGPPTIKVAGLRAFYQPGEDLAQVPFASRFGSEEEWYATLFHELGHATGHEKRLNRPHVLGVSELGPTDLGREELVVEFTASYLCAEAGIAPATVENQAAYIENWSRVLKNDRRALVVAAGSAQRAADYILDRDPGGAAGQRGVEREREQEAAAQREDDALVATTGLEPGADLDEPSLPAVLGREPERCDDDRCRAPLPEEPHALFGPAAGAMRRRGAQRPGQPLPRL